MVEHSDGSTPGESNAAPTVVDATNGKTSAVPKKASRFSIHSVNIYLLLFILMVVIAGAIIGATFIYSNAHSKVSTLKSATLSQSTLNQLATSDVNVGSGNQVLNVESSAIFAGKVLVRNSVAVAGDLQIGGALSINGLSVTGTSSLSQVQVAQNIAVNGAAAIAGVLTVQKNLVVSGNGTFGGTVAATQITTSGFQLNGALNLTHHITAGGPTPTRSNGNALGSGGTATVSGSDSSGTLSVNIGGNPTAGCFATINFTTAFNSVPHVIITPVGAAAAGLSYYVTRTSTSLSICSATAAQSLTSFAFDYLVLD